MANFGKHTGHKGFGNYYVNPETPGHLWPGSLLDKVYSGAEKLHLVLDNLNTHNETAFYEMYDSEEAERILRKIEFHYTPVHASWLNVAEIEIGVMDTECTRRRIPDKELLRQEVMAWERKRNEHKMKINWRFTKQKADEKLSKYYV